MAWACGGCVWLCPFDTRFRATQGGFEGVLEVGVRGFVFGFAPSIRALRYSGRGGVGFGFGLGFGVELKRAFFPP